ATAIHSTRTSAQKPNTTSTSPSRCQTPAWRGYLCARPSKYLVAKVWMMATANRAAPMSWMVVGFKCVLFLVGGHHDIDAPHLLLAGGSGAWPGRRLGMAARLHADLAGPCAPLQQCLADGLGAAGGDGHRELGT